MNKKQRGKSINSITRENVVNEENLKSLLEDINIGTFRNIKIIKEISHNPINKSILLEDPKNNNKDENKILLNIKQGQPTVDQVFNAIYRDGSDCQKRIVAFTGGDEWDDQYSPSADIGTVKCLVSNLNRFDLNIYMVQIIHDSTSSTCDCEILATPPSSSEFSKSQCPSIEKFAEAEFWNVYFWGYNNWTEATPYEYGFESDSQFDLCYPVGDMAITTEWTGEGATICIEDTNENNKNELDAIWNRMEPEILNLFRGCEIEILMRAGATVNLQAKVFDKPIGHLVGTPWREKRHYAGLMWSKFTQCYEFMDKAIQDLKNDGEIDNGKT